MVVFGFTPSIGEGLIFCMPVARLYAYSKSFGDDQMDCDIEAEFLDDFQTFVNSFSY